jgi:hypothetical protein
MARNYHLYIRLADHDPESLRGENPRPTWAQIADALNSMFDIVRQNRTCCAHYAGPEHDCYLLPEEAIKRAEEREERELARALLDGPASATACGARPES